ncbi:MAG: hypothetical protein ACFBWO_16230 [Paracoccaceae bacterium]
MGVARLGETKRQVVERVAFLFGAAVGRKEAALRLFVSNPQRVDRLAQRCALAFERGDLLAKRLPAFLQLRESGAEDMGAAFLRLDGAARLREAPRQDRQGVALLVELAVERGEPAFDGGRVERRRGRRPRRRRVRRRRATVPSRPVRRSLAAYDAWRRRGRAFLRRRRRDGGRRRFVARRGGLLSGRCPLARRRAIGAVSRLGRGGGRGAFDRGRGRKGLSDEPLRPIAQEILQGGREVRGLSVFRVETSLRLLDPRPQATRLGGGPGARSVLAVGRFDRGQTGLVEVGQGLVGARRPLPHVLQPRA